MAEKPKPMINLNLDEEQAPGKEPFTFTLGGHLFTFTDPALTDWQVLDEMTGIRDLVDYCMSEQDAILFDNTPTAAFKLNVLFQAVQRHFEMGEFAKPTNRAARRAR